ncbi:MAG TPA: hypothetical protein VFW96_27315 [Thermomicrobiales bacterium]|nr:hypothetical protein [Thermomicrobiales bacterium]
MATPAGPVEQLWRSCGYLVVDVEGLRRRELMLTAGCPPCAMLPDWTSGPCREDMFAGLILELAQKRVGRETLLVRLAEYGRTAATALLAASLLFGFSVADGLNLLESLVLNGWRAIEALPL